MSLNTKMGRNMDDELQLQHTTAPDGPWCGVGQRGGGLVHRSPVKLQLKKQQKSDRIIPVSSSAVFFFFFSIFKK